MPYSDISQLPETFNNLPAAAKRIALQVINSVLEKNPDDEESAIRQAWGAVKNQYQQEGDKWVKKAAELKTKTLDDVEILGTGTWKASPRVLTVDTQKLDDIVDSFNELKADSSNNYDPPIKLGHDDNQKLLQKDGFPAAGWIRAVKRVGNKLVARIEEVPAKIAELISAGAYKYVSVELNEDYKVGDKRFPCVLRACSILGGDIPVVKNISDIRNLYNVEASEEEEFSMIWYFAEGEHPLEDLISRIKNLLAEDDHVFRGKVGAPAVRTFLRAVLKELKTMTGKTSASEDDEEVDIQQYLAEKDAAYINGLPDSSFAYIQAGGKKDQEGLTTPRSLRHFPFKDADGNVDKALLADSLAKCPESELDIGAKQAAMKVLASAAEEAGIKSIEKEESMSDQEVRAMLKLSNDGDVLTAVKAVVDRAESAELKLAEAEVKAIVSKAITDLKLAPAQTDWAKAYALKDREGFLSYLESAPKVVKLGEEGAGEEGDPQKKEKNAVTLTEQEKEIAKQLNLSEEDFLKTKQAYEGKTEEKEEE